ncbi:MAG: family 20 glycosylhydrolase, partial [Calditrichaeota bacterium]|nr:family 20 glycosylhydrolase [Calditrichota bacterium]
DGKLYLTKDFSVNSGQSGDSRLNRAVRRFLFRLDNRYGLFISKQIASGNSQALLQINAKKNTDVKLHMDESYQLTVNANSIRLNSETDIGAIRGLETILQLIESDANGYYLSAVQINDAPRFPWRGLLIDVSRHWMPVDVIKRNLDAMAAVKLNTLHLHLSEDQGFRIESKTFPKLQEMGSNGDYFKQSEIKDLINYATDRGIRVMPEFDIPGHATSWVVGYPELASAPGPYTIETGFGVFDPTIDPTKEATYNFLERFFKEMTALFPDEYFHIGGDENNGKQWDSNPKIQQFMKDNDLEDNHQLQAYFNKRILQILSAQGKKMVGWDEIFQPDIPNTIVIQSWRGKQALYESAKKGYQGILSNGYYIDLVSPASFHYLNDPLPADAPISQSEKQFILGGEATMWAELITPETIDSRIWPRTAAIAERFWSNGSVNDVDDMYRRLDLISLRLEELGLTHIKNVDMMLRRLINSENIENLRVLVDLIEPVKGYKRHDQGIAYSTEIPFTRIADVARPDSRTARQFADLVERFLAKQSEKTGAVLKKWLTLWQLNHERLMPTIRANAVIHQLEALSLSLQKISTRALSAIDIISARKKATANWLKDAELEIKTARQPAMEAELMLCDAIEKLVNACK